ncbi:MAG: hypothetical protein U9Q94_07125 [Candidatus Bipolaricaulota bacterium]|nr:hypothetical protein [Candidatus Bipolaricaulota bacterium]
MVAGPPKVTPMFVVLLESLVVQRILAVSCCVISSRIICNLSGLLYSCGLSCSSSNVQCIYHFFFGQLLIGYLSSNKRYIACRAEDFNKAALDGALYLLLFGRLQAHRQRKTGEDLGVITNDLSTHELSFQSRQTISHVNCLPVFGKSNYKGKTCI